ncbi:MAG: methyltransferase domain-containing protein [Acidobacteriota bacterium]|nr:methyltransferase domain-containing protein [Acidobacteriota bacterium]
MKPCPACLSERVQKIDLADGSRCFCRVCGHLSRLEARQPDYRKQSIIGGYTAERTYGQISFLRSALRPDSTVFELGCADGALAGALRARVQVRRYEGLEISPAAAAAEGLDRVHTEWATVERGAWDLVIASHVIEHLDDIQREVGGLADLMCDGGVLFVEVPHRSGHPFLPYDTNPGHLHSFTITSLTQLLANAGLVVFQWAGNAYETLRYPDSMRVLARRPMPPAASGSELDGRLELPPDAELVVWGAGGMARELIAPFFPSQKIACYVDRNPELWGTRLGGRPVVSPDRLATMDRLYILISSNDYEADIRADLDASGFSIARIWSMTDLLDCR